MRAGFALIVMIASLFVLEAARQDVALAHFDVGATPVTKYAKPDADGPAVVVAAIGGTAGFQ